MNELASMVDMQSRLMVALGVFDPQCGLKTLTPTMSQNYLEAASGMVCEAAEVLELVTKMTRPWKAKAHTNADSKYRAVVEEATDTLFYTFELLIHLGLTPGDMEEQFRRKNAIVFARILESSFDRDEIMEALTCDEGNADCFERDEQCMMLINGIISAAPFMSKWELVDDQVEHVTRRYDVYLKLKEQEAKEKENAS